VKLPIDDATLLEFWRERRLCSLTTLRPDGTPHVVPVGATLDSSAGLVRVITSVTSRKVAFVRSTPAVAVCQFEGRQWCTVEGRATVNADPAAVTEAERRYAERYRIPRPNPRRIVLEIAVTRILGSL
jgi:F420H(2)-dependent biliverdin reductase